jgi:hypothetical protein
MEQETLPTSIALPAPKDSTAEQPQEPNALLVPTVLQPRQELQEVSHQWMQILVTLPTTATPIK